jgi:hypothetical protein
MHRSKHALCAALLAALAPSIAAAHGGGGGGGHYVYIPVYGGSVPSVVPPAKTGDYSNIKSVAVISAIATKVTLGNMALLADHKDIDVTDWNLDQTVEATVKQYLTGKFMVKPLAYDRAALAAIPNGHFDTGSAKPVDDFLRALPAQGIDAFVVVRPDSEGSAPPAAGFSLDATNGFYTRPVEVANYEIDIIDAHTGAVIGHALSRITERQQTQASFAAIYAPPDLFLSPKDTPSDYQRAEMKNDFARLIASSLRETLRSLDLGIALPEVGSRTLIPIPLDKDPHKNVHTVAVLSAVGDQLELNHRAPFFVHKLTKIPVADWNLDREIEAKMAAVLDKRWAVKAVPADRTKLANVVIDYNAHPLQTPIDGLTQTSDVDAYVVVLKNSGPVGGLSDTVSGMGLWNMNGVDGQNTGIFARYVIAVIDPHTLKPVWIQRGLTSPARSPEIPLVITSNANWPKDGGALTPDQAQRLHPAFSDIMNDSVPETMFRMALTGMMVAPAPGTTDLPRRPGTGAVATDATDTSTATMTSSAPAQPAADAK